MDPVAQPHVIERCAATAVVLDAELGAFFAAVAESGRQSALVTSEDSRLSPFVDAELRRAETTWILRDADGRHRDAVTGMRVGELRYATGPRMVDGATPAPAGTADGLVVEAVVRFRPTSTVRMGAVAASILASLEVEPPRTWGFDEPLERPWSLDALTAAARSAMPESSMIRAAGEASVWIAVRRTPRGLSESTRVLVPPQALARASQGAVAAITNVLTRQFQVELATLLRYPTAPDGWRLPGRVPAPTPVALVLGPRGVRELGLPGVLPDGVESSFVGRQRMPSQLLRFTEPSTAWRSLVSLGLPDVAPPPIPTGEG